MKHLNLYPEQLVSQPSVKIYFQSFCWQLSLAISAHMSSQVPEACTPFVITTQFGTQFHLPYIVHGCSLVISFISPARLCVSGEPVLFPSNNLYSASRDTQPSQENRPFALYVFIHSLMQDQKFFSKRAVREVIYGTHSLQTDMAGINPFSNQQAFSQARAVFATIDVK